MMGAGNVKLAYGHYAGKVPAGSLLALAFMALVAKDADDPPLFWGGHESLALSVLGRKGAYTATDARAVGRLITPLLKAGAIEVDKRSAPHRQVRYRLNLHANTGRKPSDEHRTEDGSDVGRNPSGESSNTGRKVVRTPDGNRPTEEQEEQLLQDISRTNGWTGAQGSARTRSPTTLREKIDELGRVALIQAGQLLGTSAPRGSLYIEAWRILTSDERLQLLDEHQAKRRSA